MKNTTITILILTVFSLCSCGSPERQQTQLLFVNSLAEPVGLTFFAKKDKVRFNMYLSSTFNEGTYQLSNYTLKPNEEYAFYSSANDGSKPNTVFSNIFDSLIVRTSKHTVVFKPNTVPNYLYNVYDLNEGWTYKKQTYTYPKQFRTDKVVSDNHYFTFKVAFFK